MRKILTIVLALAISLSVVGVSFGAEIDLKSMSLDELASLKESVIEEIETRLNLVSDTIATGVYRVGKDIKAGTFLITQEYEDKAVIYIYESEEAKSSHNSFGSFSLKTGESSTLTLSDGMVVSIEDFMGTIVEQVKPSWAP